MVFPISVQEYSYAHIDEPIFTVSTALLKYEALYLQTKTSNLIRTPDVLID